MWVLKIGSRLAGKEISVVLITGPVFQPDSRFEITAIEREPKLFANHFTFQNINKLILRPSKMPVVRRKRRRMRVCVKHILS